MIYNSRVTKLKNKLAQLNLDGIYVTNLTNVQYLTGFTGSAGSLLVLDDQQHFFTDGRYIEQSKEQVKNCIIHIVSSAHYLEIKDKSLIANDQKIGIESQSMSIHLYDKVRAALPYVIFEKINDIIGVLAAVKDLEEIESLKAAIEITDTVFTEIIPELKIGATEKHIAAKISYLFKMHGAEGDSYDSIIGSGYLGALPHARPTDKQFESGDFVVMDFGALYNGYHADMTRTVLIGKATERHMEIYDIVLESQLAGIKAAKAGITGADLDAVCRNVIKDAGYGNQFIHSTGHGIGLEVHTYPRISSFNTKPLLENYVVTIEPGIYIANWGGVRIEDDCWIQKDKCVPLNQSTKELLILN
ncbi:MAG: peptidase M24 family protein [Candidatus Marinimicrobia bacterium]|nr:peptidase M24 family protein [Candidatus Neomarinimicrobiota bacterium]|tara:strand:+ start:31839 stop:32915 length:1077 start_codon:yes stop_codon:yes gene_type:complete